MNKTNFEKAFKEAINKDDKSGHVDNQSVENNMTHLNEAINIAAKEAVKIKTYGGRVERRKPKMPAEYIATCKLLGEKEAEHSSLLEERSKVKDAEGKSRVEGKIKVGEKAIRELRKMKMNLSEEQRKIKNKKLRKLVKGEGGQSSKLFWRLAQKRK